jgi:hypothetical protein
MNTSPSRHTETLASSNQNHHFRGLIHHVRFFLMKEIKTEELICGKSVDVYVLGVFLINLKEKPN